MARPGRERDRPGTQAADEGASAARELADALDTAREILLREWTDVERIARELVTAAEATEHRSPHHIGVGVTLHLLDAKQAGELLGVPPSWLLRQAREDKVPHVRLGKYVRFDSADLEAWLPTIKRGPG